jgi:4-amino-4-deoxy-L-arabinose transferase-like glycosyltransferase
LLTGIIISNLALILACFYFYKLAKLDLKNKTAFRAVFYLLIFPTALFFTSIYPESTLFLFCLASFFYARKKQWVIAGVFGFLAALTKAFGSFLIFPLFLEYLEQRKFNLRKIKWNILNLAWIPAGLGIFMLYLKKKFNDPLLFLKAQGGWANNPHSVWSRTPNFSLVNIGKSLIKYVQTIFGNFESSSFKITAGFELISFIIFTILCIIVFLKLRKSYSLYMFFGLILSPLTGSLMSMNRYVLVLFPAFILLAWWGKNKMIDYTITMLFSILLAFNTIMFVNSYWVG